MSNFTHLHVHTEFSLLDGACRIAPLIAHAKKLGQTSIAITDHGVMYGVIDFYKEAKKQGIKPIIGCEVYVAPRTRFDKQHKIDSSPHHLVLLCKNETGYNNLIKLVSAGFVEGFYSKPRVDRQLLEQYSDGLIALSACLAGELPRTLLAGEYEKAKQTALYYQALFGVGNYYIEIQNHGIPEQIDVLPLLAKLAKETGIPMVATNDTHYLNKEDYAMQNVMICIQTATTVGQGSSMEFSTHEFYVKSHDEMKALFGAYDGAIENTQVIAEQCNLDFVFGQTKLPYFKTPDGSDNVEYFRNLCYSGLYKHYGQNPRESEIKRLEYELEVITRMGYTDYFLIVHDFIAYAKSKDIPVGPGRGSGAGSIAAYCVGITGIDPMKYNLLFERFLNPDRISMPDFDIDFCYERRGEVIDYVIEKYGSDHVAQIITFGTMAARGAIRDVGRALGVSYQTVDTIAKLVPFEIGMTIARAKEVSADFMRLYKSDNVNRELIDMAQKLEGMARHASTHAAGVVITREPADSYVPLQKNDASIVTQYTMTTLEELGLLKMDFLGLRNLTVIHDAQVMIRKFQPDFDIETIPLTDDGVFVMLSKGQSGGVFQFESAGMKNVLTQLKPQHMEDLIAVISLFRPGPMDSIPLYIKNRHNPSGVRYKTPLLQPILDVTYGCIVYQEQVMQICRELAGYSYGRADLVRRAMSKKKADVMEKERQSFVHGALKEDGSVECAGAVANGVPLAIANEIFDDMASFASYAFNKSHAAAYALLSYQTAYLKCHHPREYMAALLTSVLDNTDKIIDYIGECKKLDIEVLPPDVNESEIGFTVASGRIRFGLLAVKNLGRACIVGLIEQRKNGHYESLLDFFERMQGYDLNKRSVESLIRCGALDSFGHTRHSMLTGFDKMLDNVERTHKTNVSGQLNLFSSAGQKNTYDLPWLAEYPNQMLLTMEKETTGMYLSGHPLSQYDAVMNAVQPLSIKEIMRSKSIDGKEAKIFGIVSSKKLKTTKTNDVMAFVGIEDKTGTIEMIVFPRVFNQFSELFKDGQALAITGKVKSLEEDGAQLICEAVYTPEQAEKALPAQVSATKQKKLYLKFPTQQSPLFEQAMEIAEKFSGQTSVYVYFSDTKKNNLAPKRYHVSVSSGLLKELRSLLGEENVVLAG